MSTERGRELARQAIESFHRDEEAKRRRGAARVTHSQEEIYPKRRCHGEGQNKKLFGRGPDSGPALPRIKNR